MHSARLIVPHSAGAEASGTGGCAPLVPRSAAIHHRELCEVMPSPASGGQVARQAAKGKPLRGEHHEACRGLAPSRAMAGPCGVPRGKRAARSRAGAGSSGREWCPPRQARAAPGPRLRACHVACWPPVGVWPIFSRSPGRRGLRKKIGEAKQARGVSVCGPASGTVGRQAGRGREGEAGRVFPACAGAAAIALVTAGVGCAGHELGSLGTPPLGTWINAPWPRREACPAAAGSEWEWAAAARWRARGQREPLRWPAMSVSTTSTIFCC